MPNYPLPEGHTIKASPKSNATWNHQVQSQSGAQGYHHNHHHYGSSVSRNTSLAYSIAITVFCFINFILSYIIHYSCQTPQVAFYITLFHASGVIILAIASYYSVPKSSDRNSKARTICYTIDAALLLITFMDEALVWQNLSLWFASWSSVTWSYVITIPCSIAVQGLLMVLTLEETISAKACAIIETILSAFACIVLGFVLKCYSATFVISMFAIIGSVGTAIIGLINDQDIKDVAMLFYLACPVSIVALIIGIVL